VLLVTVNYKKLSEVTIMFGDNEGNSCIIDTKLTVFVDIFFLHIVYHFVLFLLFLSVHAINLATVCPFSLANLVAYGPRDQPHCPTPTKQAAPSKQAEMKTESMAVSREVGLSENSHVRADIMASRCLLPATKTEPATESTWQSHIPVNYGKFSLPCYFLV